MYLIFVCTRLVRERGSAVRVDQTQDVDLVT